MTRVIQKITAVLIGRIRSIGLIGPILILLVVGAAGSESGVPYPQTAPGAELFADRAVRTFRIEVTGKDWESLQKENRQYVKATVREGTRVFTNVGVHLKGVGSFRPLNEKPSFVLRFNKYEPGQTYSGLPKIMLNNSSQDASYLAEYMSTRLFRDAGLPAARVTHAFVQLNGRDLGLFVLIEAMNKEFLRQHFRSARGNLYEGYTQDIDQQLDQDNGRSADQSDRKKLLEVAKIADPSVRWARLQQVLDVDEFISFVVLEMFIGHTDGYTLNRNNYRIYHDPFTDRFVFITHGLDWGFSDTGGQLKPPLNSLVTKAVLDTPEGRARYRSRLAELYTNVFKISVLTNRVNEVGAKLVAAAPDPGKAREWKEQVTAMRERILQRDREISKQLATVEAVPVVFDAAGQAPIAIWRPKIDKGKGEAKLGAVSQDGRATLHIAAEAGGCIASWRSRILLPPGKYRLTGLAKTSGVVPRVSEIGSGAGLRISGGRRSTRIADDTGWTPIECSIDVPTEREVDLVCELRAEKGEVWFDRDSFRLSRGK